MLTPESELARADTGDEPLLLLRIQAAEAMHHDRPVLSEAVVLVGDERESQPGTDERRHRDAADCVGHGLCDFNQLQLRNVRACKSGVLGPASLEADRVPALRRIA